MRNWHLIRGTNYVPSHAPDAAATWTKFDEEQVVFELSLARSVGFNAVRVWLSSEAYFAEPTRFLSNFERFLELCCTASLSVIPILFDSCGTEQRGATPSLKSASELLAMFKADARYPDEVRREWSCKLERYIRDIAPLVRCEASDNPTSLIWETWRSNPGYSKLGEPHRHTYHPYVDAVVDSHRNDDRILAWDVMNEPWVTEILVGNYDDPLPGEFARHFCEHVLDKGCGVPVTVGAGTLDRALRLADCVDVISFHCYQHNDALRHELDRAYAVQTSHSKPVLLTECLAASILEDPDATTDAGQVSAYQRDLPVLAEAQIGWFQFGLMVGRAPFSYTGLFYPNGIRRPAANMVAAAIRRED